MFSLNDSMHYYLCPGPTDMRKSFIPDNMPGLFDEELTNKELIETKRQEAEEEIIAVPKVQEKKKAPRKDIMKDLPVIEEVLEPEGFERSKYVPTIWKP